jgi:hypothetical protein
LVKVDAFRYIKELIVVLVAQGSISYSLPRTK